MTGERESLQDLEGASKLDQAKEAVHAATNTVKATSQTIADAIDAGRNPLDRMAHWAREAPLHSIAVAFLLGALLGGRRRR
jgi:ElaB/YqjD/DUF883 family membrane-anchored ribosome-binding protein